MLLDRQKGAKYEELVMRYGCTYKTVYNVCAGKTQRSARAIVLLRGRSPTEVVRILCDEIGERAAA